jgi:hypothetical protein
MNLTEGIDILPLIWIPHKGYGECWSRDREHNIVYFKVTYDGSYISTKPFGENYIKLGNEYIIRGPISSARYTDMIPYSFKNKDPYGSLCSLFQFADIGPYVWIKIYNMEVINSPYSPLSAIITDNSIKKLDNQEEIGNIPILYAYATDDEFYIIRESHKKELWIFEGNMKYTRHNDNFIVYDHSKDSIENITKILKRIIDKIPYNLYVFDYYDITLDKIHRYLEYIEWRPFKVYFRLNKDDIINLPFIPGVNIIAASEYFNKNSFYKTYNIEERSSINLSTKENGIFALYYLVVNNGVHSMLTNHCNILRCTYFEYINIPEVDLIKRFLWTRGFYTDKNISFKDINIEIKGKYSNVYIQDRKIDMLYDIGKDEEMIAYLLMGPSFLTYGIWSISEHKLNMDNVIYQEGVYSFFNYKEKGSQYLGSMTINKNNKIVNINNTKLILQ